MTSRRCIIALAAVAVLAPTAAALAQGADPAIATIDGLDAALLETMKSKAGAEARYTKLLPAVERTFDMPTMTRLAVGDAWTSYSAGDQAALVKAFTRLSAANLAHNFAAYDGEQFKVNPQVQTRLPDKLVRSQIIPREGDPTDLNYRMREAGGAWKVVDVYFGSISQLAAQRSDFAATAVAGGAGALTKKINAKADELLK